MFDNIPFDVENVKILFHYLCFIFRANWNTRFKRMITLHSYLRCMVDSRKIASFEQLDNCIPHIHIVQQFGAVPDIYNLYQLLSLVEY